MAPPDWLLLIGKDGIVEAVDGGAPSSWVARRADECAGLPEAARVAVRRLVREHAEPRRRPLLRRIRVEPEGPDAPSFQILVVEGIRLRPAEVALAPLVRRALEPLAQQALALGVSLAIESQHDLPDRVSLDATKIAWAVTTLVGNSLRYVRRGRGTTPGGSVVVALAHNPAQRMLSVTVEDDGPGIAEDVRTRLFKPGPQGDAAGLSLRLVHDVVTAHGGGIVVKSGPHAEDRGTLITLWIPART